MDSKQRGRPPKNMKSLGSIAGLNRRAVLHMGVWDIEAADIIRKRMHELYLSSYHDTGALLECMDVLEQFFIVFAYSLPTAMMEGIEKDIRATMDQLAPLRITNQRIDRGAYDRMREAVSALIKKLYWAKQQVNLGIPSERITDDETMITEGVKGA